MNARVLVVVVLAGILSACAPPGSALAPTPTAVPATPERSMKGWELYSWREGGAWRFVLLPGTNRVKSTGEILQSPEAVTGIKPLRARLARLAKGEQVFWGRCEASPFACPPKKEIATIRDFCKEAGLELTVAPNP